MIGVEGHDLEEVLLMQNPRFWKMIEARRTEPTLGLDEARRQLGLSPARRRRRCTAGAQRAALPRPSRRSKLASSARN
jgi:hypothetical protein